MRCNSYLIPALFGVFSGLVTHANADWVELSNNDLIHGQVVSLDELHLKLKNPNFGEMTIPRDKVKIIGFGERPVTPVVPQAAQKAIKSSSELPSLENQELGQLFQEVLGSGGVAELQQKINNTRDELKSLRKDFRSGSGDELDALDSYIQIFDLFGKLSTGGAKSKPARTQKATKEDNAPPPKANP